MQEVVLLCENNHVTLRCGVELASFLLKSFDEELCRHKFEELIDIQQQQQQQNYYFSFVNESLCELIYGFVLNSLLFTFIHSTVDMAITNKINVNTIWVMIDCLLYKKK